MTVLLGTMLIFAFAGSEAYAANVIMDENTTQLENGNTYVVGGTVKCSDRINVQGESEVRLNPYRVAAMIDGLKKPYEKAEVQDVYDAYMRLVEGGYSIPDQDLAKLQAAVDYCKLVDMINGLKKPYDKAEVQKTCNAYKRLAGDGYSIPAPELAKLQAPKLRQSM